MRRALGSIWAKIQILHEKIQGRLGWERPHGGGRLGRAWPPRRAPSRQRAPKAQTLKPEDVRKEMVQLLLGRERAVDSNDLDPNDIPERGTRKRRPRMADVTPLRACARGSGGVSYFLPGWISVWGTSSLFLVGSSFGSSFFGAPDIRRAPGQEMSAF